MKQRDSASKRPRVDETVFATIGVIVACLGLVACSSSPTVEPATSTPVLSADGSSEDLRTTPQPTVNPIDPFEQARLQAVPCWFDDPGVEPLAHCFQMHVPEQHGVADSPTITFPVVRISNPWGDSDKTPILHLGGGGPGNPMGLDEDTVGNWIWSWYQQISIGDNRDIYLLDPRGVGLARPVLVCREYIPRFLGSLSHNLTTEQEIAWNVESNQQCVERLVAQGIDVAAYNSLAVARDMELLRQQLDVDRWNLYGVSYGSRYALTMAREYPDTVESMVLDAAVFPNIRYMNNYAQNLQQAYNRLLTHCESSKSCSQALGEPRRRFWALVRSLDSQPIVTRVTHPQRDQQINFVLNSDRFLGIIYNALYDAEKFNQLDEIILSLESGQLGPFETLVNDWLVFQTDDDYGDASAAAHYCYEESPFIDYEGAIEQAGGLRNELRESAISLLEFNRTQCSRWPVPAADEVEGRPVITDIPVLFLHGALDPVLPVEDLQAQLSNFANAEYEIFSNTSHSIVGVHPCGEELASAFYAWKSEFRQHTNCTALE